MKIPLQAYWKAIQIFARSVRKHGLDATNARVEAIGRQSDFWFEECQALYRGAILAQEAGDLELFNTLRARHIVALRRFKNEVADPLKELEQ